LHQRHHQRGLSLAMRRQALVAVRRHICVPEITLGLAFGIGGWSSVSSLAERSVDVSRHDP
jgi:hypothetical protein